VDYQLLLGRACHIHAAAKPRMVAAREFDEPHPAQWVPVADVAAAHAEALERSAGRDISIGQPKLEHCDGNVDAPNVPGEFGVVLGHGKQAHLTEAFHDDFRLGQFLLVAVMAVHHRGREDTRLPQCPFDDFVRGHQQRPFMRWERVNDGVLSQELRAGGERNRKD
jgi:hypothetical protein